MSDVSEDSGRARRAGGRTDAPAGLPDASVYSFAATGARASAAARGDFSPAPASAPPRRLHNIVFESLVTAETDLVGFVAYGLYKQNKRDWFIAFEREQGRIPNEGEIASYVVGESTERRLAIYRRLAEEIAGEASQDLLRRSQASVESSRLSPSTGRRISRSAARDSSPRRRSFASSVALFLVLMILVAGMAFVLRSGVLPLGVGRW
jgi:hypothetical protein